MQVQNNMPQAGLALFRASQIAGATEQRYVPGHEDPVCKSSSSIRTRAIVRGRLGRWHLPHTKWTDSP
jgi:hypothetical protein